ncbi:SPOR domain-containing protein [Duganella sp. FT80W]|uniref:SPOR domain-containing protein n=1 Tax=Duganella guangzhouensis TaxID=2666084 RepID=A0A6I2L764_9BURK|nr:SPOR domain-containing protein [Duganella guangzhouensis]MRW93988.1 SPOR domain-containing protein [Duganella guangzhouensis]
MNFRSSFTPRSKQQGNTFIGIIIGLVIGLSIAVVVALMITKGSTPFTDKGHPSKTTEPTAGQIADPNKPMYGNKDAAREAAKDLSRDQQAPAAPAAPAPAASAADQLQAVVDKIQAAPAKPAPAVPNAANVTPQPAAKAAAPAAAAADAGDEKFTYYLQAGAFREVADAENARAKLALLGFEANISDRATDTGVLHRVRLGPYNQVETMNKVRSKLSENGVDVAVVRNQK